VIKLRFLGTGTSHGIPVPACQCPVCTSTDPRDNRYRSSVVIEGSQGEVVLIDAGPEFRLQAIRAGIRRLDALLITHAHADHVHGLDDVRTLTTDAPLPVYASPDDLAEIKERFAYVFRDGQQGGGKPRLNLVEPGPAGISVGTLRAVPVPLLHGNRMVFGYRIGGLAYLTDCSSVPEASLSLLHGLDIMVVDALRIRPHPTHFSLDQAFDLARKILPARLLLTRLCHELSHRQIQDYCDSATLPFQAGPAWDDLQIELPEF